VTRKKKVLSALKENGKKYRTIVGQSVLTVNDNPLCQIYLVKHVDCSGCPLSLTDGRPGCVLFSSFKAVEKGINGSGMKDPYAPVPKEKASSLKKPFKKRALFYKKVGEIVKGWPDERFTKKGWKFEQFPLEW